ncbi:hypothetical protein DFJ77DRAFT_474060 [Powellomyces hirtus]|nr:hypothetical protein DFJ77DRAFT_474060 [Powellomyces hirtus]
MLKGLTGANGPPRRFKRPAFASTTAAAAPAVSRDAVIQKLVKQARASGRLNLSNQHLKAVPEALWGPNDGGKDAGKKVVDFSFDRAEDAGGNWWEVVDLVRLIMADNLLQVLDDRVGDFHALAVLDVRNNQLHSLPSTLVSLQTLAVLNVSGNRLTSLPEGLLRGLPSLTDLNLANNGFTELTEEVLPPRLTILDVSGNKLSKLPRGVARCGALVTLNVAKNQLEVLVEDGDNDQSIFESLEDLDASDNVLTRLFGTDSTTVTLPSLNRLDLRHNKLTHYPSTLRLPSLKELYLSHNTITPPPVLASSPYLRTLDLSNNAIAEFPTDVLGLKELKRLDVSNNNVLRLPPQLGLLMGLDVLLFSGNPIRGFSTVGAGGTARVLASLRDKIVDVPEYTSPSSSNSTSRSSTPTTSLSAARLVTTPSAQASATRTLDLSQRQLATLDPDTFIDLPFAPATLVLHHNAFTTAPTAALTALAATLTTLVLSHNRLAHFPDSVALPHLTHLDLASNQITTIPDTLPPTHFPSLVELNLARNKLASLSATALLTPFPKLETFLAPGNTLKAIDPATFVGLPNLQVLDLADNDIAQLNPKIAACANLKVLRVAGNSFRVPRRDIVEKGTDAILAYLRDRIPT